MQFEARARKLFCRGFDKIAAPMYALALHSPTFRTGGFIRAYLDASIERQQAVSVCSRNLPHANGRLGPVFTLFGNGSELYWRDLNDELVAGF